ncbi:chemotaxis protein CheW [Dethiobacter alkaliphilus]|uniref:CheW protein n=1 Tax=Dethiobacter alkaliphilus AHT 1 TaxID=555088 RepID=C0GJT7_DETAL|nr:chemotaxis protein CheW [Dethiobacter alkaliphilus]EEG76395.1 CheW protein [Dethiobacter alkaliphilus AHT 1]
MNQSSHTSVSEQLIVLFNLNNEEFALPVNQVREVIKIPEVTKLPGTADYVQGVVTIRGKVIPVINLKKRFRLPVNGIQESSKIIIAESGREVVGLIVDHVNEVKKINLHEIQMQPQIIEQTANRYIEGVVFEKEDMYIIINLEKIFAINELLQLSSNISGNEVVIT